MLDLRPSKSPLPPKGLSQRLRFIFRLQELHNGLGGIDHLRTKKDSKDIQSVFKKCIENQYRIIEMHAQKLFL